MTNGFSEVTVRVRELAGKSGARTVTVTIGN
jgi:hypothetical protein